MKIIGYLRVSTQEQAHGYGMAVQEQAIRSWARSERAQLVGVERDEAVSGSNGLESRAGLTRALRRLKNGEADALVVHRLDRLARDVVLQETWIRQLTSHGGQVISVSESHIDGRNDPTRQMVRVILGAVAEYERLVIRERMMSGKAAKRDAGGYIGGNIGFGYAASDGALVPRSDEQAGLTMMRELRAEGKSYEVIARALDEAGISPRKGGRWHRYVVAGILKESA